MTETIARVRIELEGTAPLVWRELDLPLSTTLASLHDIIQVVMRWQDYHLHEFVVGDKIYGVPDLDDVFSEIRLRHCLHRSIPHPDASMGVLSRPGA